MTTEQIIWNFLKQKGLTDYAVAGIMGNLQAESGLRPNNLEDTKSQKLGLSDEEYTRRVDNGTYSNFIIDECGYGIAQWTTTGRKRKLFTICKANNKSISDLGCQLTLLYEELVEMNLIDRLNKCRNIGPASDIILKEFENPLDKSTKVQNYRSSLSKNFYDKFKGTQGGTTMKYTDKTPPLVCMLTNSTCYKGTTTMEVKGVLWHSTGANNPTLKRYVQPSEGDKNYKPLLAKIGTNPANNDWNHIDQQVGVNAFIGKLADGTIATAQTLPWDYRPWGCGSGSRGSCNSGWIQFEICEDALNDKNYFDAIYKEACELTAYLCKKFNLNPKGSVNFNSVKVPVILCHQDSYQLGLGSNHADVYHWFSKFGKSMNNVREDIAAILNGKAAELEIPSDISTIKAIMTDGIIRRGDAGAAVKQLQENLISLGYSVGSYGADGDFGRATLEAVMKFQKDQGLMADGEVGPMTKQALQSALNRISEPQVYRVRKTWNDMNSQVGAFTNLDNAKKICDAYGSDYSVFNNTGKVIYTPEKKETSSSETYNIVPAKKYSDVMIGSSSKDERGQYRGGQAGDQTGKEVYINNWYAYNWTEVLRPKTALLAEKIAVACEKACANNNIGYDQLTRNTLLKEAKYAKFDMSKIDVPCNCDCSSFVSTCCVCAGLPENIFFPGGNGCVTTNLADACLKTGQFDRLTNSKYLNQKSYLRRGDILLNKNAHVVMVVGSGANAEPFPVQHNQSSSSTNTNVKIDTNGVPFRVRVTANALNIRQEPNHNAKVIAQIKRGQVHTVMAVEGGFGKLKASSGWVDLSYVERI